MKQAPKTKLLRLIIAIFFFTLIFTLPAMATVFNVNTTNDTHAVNPLAGTGIDAGGNISLRSALEAANAVGGMHTVNLPAGIYLLTEGEIVLGDIAQNITIQGAGSSLSIIDMAPGVNQDRMLFINSTGTTADVHTIIRDVQFRNGHLNSDPYGGGAIRAGGPVNELTISNCIFSNNAIDLNAGTTGGAINMAGGGALNIDHCTFTGNSNPVSDGGAVYYFLQNFPGLAGSISITNSTFDNNTSTIDGSGSGGAIGFAEAGAAADQTFSATIRENTFTNNTAPGGEGGAIIADNSFGLTGTVNINYNRFVGNSSSNSATSGLGMNSSDGSVDATNNWWGCNTGPNLAGACDKADVVGFGGGGTLTSSPWLELRTSASPNPICTTAGGAGNTSTVTASFLSNSANVAIAPADLDALIGLPISFVNPTLGTLSGAQTTIQASGAATVLFTSNGIAGTGTVNAVVDNVPNNDADAKASITVNAAPTITVQPANTTVCTGTTAQFTVTATGTAPLSYQWYRGATPLANGPSGTGSTYSGATTATLTISNTSAADNGNDYKVVVSNSCGTATSALRTLTTTSLTVTNPAVTTGTLGVPFSQSFTQSGGTLPVTFTTMSALPPGLGLSSAGVLSGTPSQTGSFTLVVKVTDANGCTGTGPNYNLTINCPSVTVDPVGNQTVCVGSSTSAVNFTGMPSTTVFNWTNNNTSIGLAAAGTGNIPSFTTMNGTNAAITATITVTPVYTYGSSTCTGAPQTFMITVVPRPVLRTTINSVTVTANNDGMDDNAVLTVCNSAGDNLFFTQFIDALNVTPSASVKVIQQFTRTNVTFGPGDGVFPISAYSPAFNRNTSLVNPAVSGTLVMRFRAFFDANNNNMLDGNECAGDWIVYTVTVNPQPINSCPGNITTGNDPGVCSAVVNYTVGVSTSPAAIVSYMFSGATAGGGAGTGSGATFNKGMTTVAVTATNSCGTQTCTFSVMVNDTEKPTASNPTGISVQCISGIPAPDPNVVTNEADNCVFTSVSFLNDANNGGSGCPGNPYIVTRTYRVTDGSGNFFDVFQTITAIDNTAPVLTGILPGGAVGNVCFANRPAAPSTATIASKYTDNCTSGVATLISTNTTGDNCGWSVTYTYSIKDACGNPAANAVVTFTGADTEAPHQVLPLPGGPAGNLCKSAAPPAPSNATVASKYSDNCSAVTAALLSSNVTGTDCSWTATYVYSIKDGCNNAAANAVVTYTGGDTEAPHQVAPLPGGATGNGCKSAAPPAPSNATIASKYADNCSAVSATLTSSTVTGTDCNWTATYVYSVKDACNNSTTATVVYTGGDTQAPTFTRPADITIPFTGTCSYNASPANTGSPTNVMDNCTGAIAVTFSDVVSQCGYNTVITRTWKATDVCGNFSTQVQMITVTDNNTPYIIYAKSEAKFGESNLINGDVGVTDANGKADFKKNDVLDPYHVYAKNITVQSPAMVNNKHFVPATGGPNPAFIAYSGTGGSGNFTQSANGIVVGNYKNLTIKKNVIATVTGNDFGKITIEEGADVTFTASSINVQTLEMKKGKKNTTTTNVHFTGCTAVMVRDKVSVEDDCNVNVGGPKVIFYMGDNNSDPENFEVKGNNSQVTANIIIPHGDLHVSGGDDGTIMTGWFITEKLNSDGKNVVWNKYGCSPLAARTAEPVFTQSAPAIIKEVHVEVTSPQAIFQVKVYPNPSSTDFSIQVMSSGTEPVSVRIMDANGTDLKVSTSVLKGSVVRLGAGLRGGTYFAEVVQGHNRQVLRLVKLN